MKKKRFQVHTRLMSLTVTSTRVLDQPALHLRSADGAEASVLLYGGHVVSFRTATGDELLYLSPQATTANGTAVRGGIPIIFPQFDRRGPVHSVQRHGFARTGLFKHSDSECDSILLQMHDNEATRATFPFAFLLSLRISLSANSLTLDLQVHNSGHSALAFTCALHTYLRVNNLDDVKVIGLQGCDYEDKVLAGARHSEQASELRIRGEVDRIYSQPQAVQLHDGPREVRVTQEGFPDIVVWNPGPGLAAGLSDLPDDGYLHMLCLEAAHVIEPAFVQPGESFRAKQCIVGA